VTADLFQKSPNTPASIAKSDYTAKDIEVLEGLEPVRHRPGMYIGGTDEKAMHHLVAEILDNAMDEVVAGFATKIEVKLEAGDFVTIRDNGRGIPTDPHPKFPHLSALEVIFTTLHSGGKFSDKVYTTSGGLHGVGVSVVNALSDILDIEVTRDKQTWRQSYSRGCSTTTLIKQDQTSRLKGTSIRFHPDPEIFGEACHFSAHTVFQMVKAKAYLFKGVEVTWICDPSLITNGKIPEKTILHYPKGLADYLRDFIDKEDFSEDSLFSGEATFPNQKGRVEWAVAWMIDDPESQISDTENPVSSFCNTIPTPQGGTHEQGLRQALTRGLKDYGERINNRKANQLTAEDVNGGAAIVLSCFIKQPQFQGQTKERLASAEATRLVENVIKDHLDHWLTQHPQLANRLLDFLVNRAEDRLKRRQAREVSRASATRRLRLPGKLADCTSNNPLLSELFLVEGDSAGGSAKQARDRATQAVLPLKGKILNVATATLDKMKGNQEIADLMLALGCGVGTHCDPNKLRYSRIIIMTDADVDGAHIASLLLTFFFQEMRTLIDNGHIYLAQPPLYRLTHKGETHYARDDAEKDKLLASAFHKNAKVEISRFKGLGEMPVVQLRNTTMDPKQRVLLRVSMDDCKSEDGYEAFVNRLMGKNPETRYNFICENASFITGVDI
jgi:topoisomerase-4 subunit B